MLVLVPEGQTSLELPCRCVRGPPPLPEYRVVYVNLSFDKGGGGIESTIPLDSPVNS